jgi:LVIVD repeat
MEEIRLKWRLLARALAMAALALVLEGRAVGADGPLTRVNTVALGTAAHDIVLEGNLAYVATDAGLMILDLANPAFPVVRGSAAISGSGKSIGLHVEGGYAYLACQNAGLQVFDVSNPDAPTLVAVRKVIGAVWDVAVKDHIAYVVSFSGELYLFDITVPTNPVQIRMIGLPAWRSPAGDAANLTKLNNYVTSGNAKATGVSVAGSHLFATDWAYGRLYYYDVTNAGQPVFAGTHDAPFILRAEADPVRDVVYMLSASGGVSGIYTVPISALGPTHSTRHSTCGVCGYLKSNYGIDMGGLGIVPGGRYMFYAGGKVGEFHVVDVTDPAHMQNVASTTIGPHRVQLAQTMGLQAFGDYLYFAAGATGIQVFTFPGLSD